MQFGRQVRRQTLAAANGDGERGWVCSDNRRHFELASEYAGQKTATSAASQARWADDGGNTPGEQKAGPHF